MKNNTIWACAIYNMISVVCFTLLAMGFNRWWIALFAILFLTFPKTVKQHYRVCNRCGKHSPYADSHNEALDKAKAAGWIHHVDGDKDYCPECKMSFQEVQL